MSILQILDLNPRVVVKTGHLRIVGYHSINQSRQGGIIPNCFEVLSAWVLPGTSINDLTPLEKQILNRKQDNFANLEGTDYQIEEIR